MGKIMPVETNIIIFEVKERFTAAGFRDELVKHGVYTIAISPSQVRIVTHLDVTEEIVATT